MAPPSTLAKFRQSKYASPFILLVLWSIAGALCFTVWNTLLNNFAVQQANFTGREIGLLQSVREIPGFLAFTIIFFLAYIKEQKFALIALSVLGLGTAITGLFPTLTGLLITTFIMSTGFHYFETANQSLQLQWLNRKEAPEKLGSILAATSFARLLIFGSIFLMWQILSLDFVSIYLIGGGVSLLIVLALALCFPHFEPKVHQTKKIILRKRYWLYYAITFLAGARRQIFTVFASWLMVEKFGFAVHEIALVFLINVTFNMLFAKRIGRAIGQFGERTALVVEYSGLIFVFIAHAFVQSANVAVALYIIDHAFFAMAFARRTYFQKIGDDADMASTAAVTFTINHIAAVVLPVAMGFIWIKNPSAVFLIGAFIAAGSLVLATLIPRHPQPGHETVSPFSRAGAADPAE